ncbi:hypothetical protein [Cryobacterium sp. BB307]|uniref:5' nucleotidase, NT5C type n=1 Tax=Cryobacterium sp. BB307 TaxID=2716317 RepID=UPI001B2FE4DB|nr:hypothetical protein [Cryobacterium sp. BB307]
MTETAVPPARKILYIDLDNTLVDFPSGIDRLHPDVAARYAGHLDDAPGIFALMDPLPDALEAYGLLAAHFDTYILSTAPWDNPSAWHDKVEWVRKHLGFASDAVAYKRLILSHHKNLNRGDFLVDDRDRNGADQFEGEWLHFGPGAKYPTWKSVTEYLLSRAEPSQLDVAINLARAAHAGQRDMLGVAYICHPLAVMGRLETLDEKIVGVLHDVVEDTPVTLDYLRTLGFEPHIVAAVDAITKRTDETLEESLARVRANPLALRVKLADISHNAEPDRQKRLTAEQREQLDAKYRKSAELLGTSLDAIFAEFLPPRPQPHATTASAGVEAAS